MNILKNILYMAKRFKTATALNLIGLIVGFSACYLFLTQVVYNHSYNTCLKEHDRLYRVEVNGFFTSGEWLAYSPRYLADCLEKLPQVESASFIMPWGGNWVMRKGETEMDFEVLEATNKGISTLIPGLLDGTLEWSEEDKEGLLIPASIAKTYFGEVQVAGRYMNRGQDSLLVRGVYQDLPENCVISNVIYRNILDNQKDQPHNFNGNSYVRLKQGVDTVGLANTFRTYINHSPLLEQSGDSLEYLRLNPVKETWFSKADSFKDKGNQGVDWVLQLSCLLVLLIAAINFLNFTLAESPMRIKSINTRKVLGSSTLSLRLSLVGETVLISVVSFIASLGILYLLSQWPEMRQLVKGSIALSDHPILVTVLALTSIVVGIVAGTYPALYVTSFQPALVLKGSFGLTPKGRQLRTGLLCLQFAITSIMAVYIGILELQSDYIYNSKCGYDKEALMTCWNSDLYEKRDALRNELLQLTGIEDVSYSQFQIGVNDQYMFWSRGDKDHVISFTVFVVDNHYLNTLGIKMTEGRNFNENEDNTYIINEAARQMWDWVELDKPLLEGQPKVIGVCENPRFATTRIDNNSSPLVLVVSDPNYPWFVELRAVNIRVAAGIDKIKIRKQIQEVFMRMGARHEPDVKFQNQQLEEAYQEEFLFIRQVIIFSIICLIITLIGVFCLTMFETEYRRKEIGIRKVMGSSTTEILTLLCRRYVWLLLGSFAVAAPVAWHLGNVWLQSFAEHTPIYWWLFPLALFVVSLVTLATIIIQSWRVANANPVESVKSE